MARNTNKAPKDSQATVKPEIIAETSATEAEKSASQAATQAETGNEAVSEAGNSPLPGEESQAVQHQPAEAGQGEADGPVVSHIIITAKKEGFRRAGRAWSKTPTTVDMDELTAEQIDALVLEPMLDVAFLAE
ncbi:MAG TPA: HI1506-related protein [Rhodocyclaceae bacterium]|nr:HI1506-related protein [Rhodocyclaceae bacterium]